MVLHMMLWAYATQILTSYHYMLGRNHFYFAGLPIETVYMVLLASSFLMSELAVERSFVPQNRCECESSLLVSLVLGRQDVIVSKWCDNISDMSPDYSLHAANHTSIRVEGVSNESHALSDRSPVRSGGGPPSDDALSDVIVPN